MIDATAILLCLYSTVCQYRYILPTVAIVLLSACVRSLVHQGEQIFLRVLHGHEIC